MDTKEGGCMEDHGFMELEQRKAFLIKFCYWGVIGLCTYMAVKFLLPVLFPFAAAYAIAYVLDKPARRMAGGSRWKRTVSSVLLSMAFFILAGGLAVWLGAGIFSGIKQLFSILPAVFGDFVVPLLEDGFVWVEKLFHLADPSVLEFLEGGFDGFESLW